MVSYHSTSLLSDYDILRVKMNRSIRLVRCLKIFQSIVSYLGEVTWQEFFQKAQVPQCLTLTSLEILGVFPSVLFCFDAEELFLLLPLFSLLLLLLDFKEEDWLIVLFREPCSVFGSFEGTGPAGEGNKSFSLAVLCLDDLPNQTNALISPHSHVRVMDFSHLTLPHFKINLFFPIWLLEHMISIKQNKEFIS